MEEPLWFIVLLAMTSCRTRASDVENVGRTLDVQRSPAADSSSAPINAEHVVIDAAEQPDAETVCRLFDGCDGSVDCPPHRLCARCFAAAATPSARAECEDLYLRNACLSRCRRDYVTCERNCRRVYRDPSHWPEL